MIFSDLRHYVSTLEKIGHLNISGALHPVALKDGRIMFSTLESQGIRSDILWGVWTIHPDGSGLEQVSSRKSSALYPTWSPNSQRIAVTGSGNKTPNAILELGRTDEKAVVSLPLLPTGDNLNPFSWSRDGR